MQRALIDNKIPAAKALFKTFKSEAGIKDLLINDSDESAENDSD